MTLSRLASALPLPQDGRWKPLRAGLLDVFYYDAQEFWFRDGRLLLRGNNGAGKSKVLALTLPFLLDGELTSYRVEPDADPKKRMEWNLLLGGAHPHPERVGYTWLEFGRIDEDGVARYWTIGCGLKAVAGKGIAAHWFFVSPERVGDGLHLADHNGTPLTRDRLGDALAASGRRYDRAKEYRAAVDEALFGFGEQRYAALVDLLIRLRQPQLSKKPSEKALSAALTESLPPLGQAVLADVAEAFRSLEEDRADLAAMSEAHEAATAFFAHYRRYARVASRRYAAKPRAAHSKYEQVGRELAESDRRLAEATLQRDEGRAELDAVEHERVRLAAHEAALRGSEAMEAATLLDGARKRATMLADVSSRADAAHAAATAATADRRARVDRARAGLERADGDLARAREDAASAAMGAALEAPHRDAVDAVLDMPDIGELRRTAAELVTTQSRAIKHVGALIAEVERHAAAVTAARARVGELDASLSEIAEVRAAAEDRVRAAAAALVAGVREHHGSATELAVHDVDAVLDELLPWAESLSGENPYAAAVATCAAAVRDAIARADTTAEAVETAERDVVAGLEAERARLESGHVDAPAPRHTVDPDRPGARLWQLVDFSPDLTDEERAGLEAALEASGALDATVSVDGELVGADVIASGGNAAPGRTLATVLRVAIDPASPAAGAVSTDTVEAVLRAIALGPESKHHTWMATDGTFRVGTLTGAWRKAEPQYVGAGAREQARRRRLAELADEIAATEGRLDEIAARRETLRARRGTVDAELAALPAEGDLRAAHQTVAAAQHRELQLRDEHASAVAAVDRARATHRDAAAVLDQDAADAALPTDREALDEIRDFLSDYREAVAVLWSRLEAARAAAARLEDERRQLEDAAETEAERALEAERHRSEAFGARTEFETLEASIGADVADLMAQLEQVDEDKTANATARRAAEARHEAAVQAYGKAEGEQGLLRVEREETGRARDAEVESFRRFAETGLLSVAIDELEIPDTTVPWVATTAIAMARTVEAELLDVDEDDKTWDRLQRRVTDEHKALADVLSRQGNSTGLLPRDGVIVVDVMFRGRPTTVGEVAHTLESEVTERSRLLTEREREILENHLVSEAASSLQELITAAEQQVARMNTELASRPTSTGMQLRINWVPSDDAPAGAQQALRQLRRTADVWNEADRAAVGEFLQHQIERVRAADVGKTWLEHLTEALDYRRWNRFTIERKQNGQWRPATGPASGGEGALVASVPLFAAAAAHYGSAGNPHAPRLVTLDEAFAGVDDDARAKYLGLLAAFDLDVVMTSEREWGCYPEVPGLAIAQLARTEGVDAVLVTHWEWDGRALATVNRPDAAIGPPDEPGVVANDGPEGLWD